MWRKKVTIKFATTEPNINDVKYRFHTWNGKNLLWPRWKIFTFIVFGKHFYVLYNPNRYPVWTGKTESKIYRLGIVELRIGELKV